MTSSGTARDLLSRAQSALSLPSTISAFDAAGIAELKADGIRDLTTLVETSFEGRAAMDVTFGLSDSVTGRVGYIETISLTGNVTGP
jgi:hypothetical protein